MIKSTNYIDNTCKLTDLGIMDNSLCNQSVDSLNDERIRLTGVEVLPPSVDSIRVTAVLSGEKEKINRTKVQLYTIIAAFRDEKGTDVEVYDSGNMFVMRFDNSCAAEFVREFINNSIEK